MHNDCTTVDELIEEIANYNSEYQDVAVGKLKQLCLQSYEAYAYLYVRLLNESLPASAQKRLDDILTTVRTHSHVSYECWQTTNRTSRDERTGFTNVSRHF